MILRTLHLRTVFAYRVSTFKLRKGSHPSRYYLYEHLARFSAPRSDTELALSVSHSEQLAGILGYQASQITDASYPACNILDLPFDDDKFDAVIADQILEHVAGDPNIAVRESFRVVKPDGLVVFCCPFLYPIHGCPNDFWRFTPNGLRLLVERYGTIVEVGGWGNRFVWVLWALGLRFEPMPHATWHPAHWLVTRNEPGWPIVTWIIARKRS